MTQIDAITAESTAPDNAIAVAAILDDMRKMIGAHGKRTAGAWNGGADAQTARLARMAWEKTASKREVAFAKLARQIDNRQSLTDDDTYDLGAKLEDFAAALSLAAANLMEHGPHADVSEV